jgi:hypothetical protein
MFLTLRGFETWAIIMRGIFHHEYEASDGCFIILNELTHTFIEES